ncbi:hypothetical protein BG006_010136, partial [Podila minutissima]
SRHVKGLQQTLTRDVALKRPSSNNRVTTGDPAKSHSDTSETPELVLGTLASAALDKAFSIKIPSNDTVAEFKNLIKTEKSPEFDDVAADKLTLWDVSFLECIILKDLPAARKLHPMEKISDVFKDPLAEKTVSIIVQRPPQERSFFMFAQSEHNHPYSSPDPTTVSKKCAPIVSYPEDAQQI